MTGERIARSVLMSAALVLGVVGCPPVDPGDDDAGVTGGRGTAGTPAGGNGTAGDAASVPVCTTVASLPTMYTACTTYGESQCDADGNRCVCERGYWYCDTICAATYPTEPTPDSACIPGAACTYPSGVGCECFWSRWVCTGNSSCPAAANMPTTGQACNVPVGAWCDYPNTNPAFHFVCICSANADASTVTTWTCMQIAPCPTTQPAYDLNVTCTGPAICSYGSTLCKCWGQGLNSPWVCGFGSFHLVWGLPPDPNCSDCE